MTQEKVGYSGLYPNTQTSWRVSNKNGLQVSIITPTGAGPYKDFYTKGVRYQPTPINIEASEAGTPMGDFYYCGDIVNKVPPLHEPMLFYQPIWLRDVGPEGLIRNLGANTIAVYNTFNVPPQTMSQSDGKGTVVSSASTAGESAIDWTALGPVQYDGTNPSEMPTGIAAKTSPPYWYHYNHDVFLDMCWNDGVDPIYVWLAVGMSNQVVFSANPAPADGGQFTQWQTFYENSAEWLAKSYANHPAVIGFIITNETNSSITAPYKEYWDAINKINTLLKANAPTKLTMVGMQDSTQDITNQLCQYTTAPTPGGTTPATELLYLQKDGSIGPSNKAPNGTTTKALPKHIYEPDVWGWNLYAVPNETTPSVAYFLGEIGSAYQKPVIVTETGVPAAMRYNSVSGVSNGTQGGNDPYFINPNGYEAVYTPAGTNPTTPASMALKLYDPTKNALGIESPPIQSILSTDRTTYLTTNPQFNGGGLIVYETDTTSYFLLIGNPASTSPDWFELTNPNYLPLLDNWRKNQYTAPAAAIGMWAALTAMATFQVNGSGVAASSQIYNGAMAFEHCDEWFKWVDPLLSTKTAFTAAGVHDFRDTAISPWGPADAQFYTAWEEEWFGLCSVLPTSRNSTDPAISSDGWLNGGADTLTPRALYYAVQAIFKS